MSNRSLIVLFAIAAFLYVVTVLKTVAPMDPPNGYRIKIGEVVYYTDSYIADGDYIQFRDEFGRDVEVRKKFVNIEEVK